MTRDELKQRAVDHVKSLERKAIQEQIKFNEMMAASTREKSMHTSSRGAAGESRKSTSSRRR